jgi:hypothetical protein
MDQPNPDPTPESPPNPTPAALEPGSVDSTPVDAAAGTPTTAPAPASASKPGQGRRVAAWVALLVVGAAAAFMYWPDHRIPITRTASAAEGEPSLVIMHKDECTQLGPYAERISESAMPSGAVWCGECGVEVVQEAEVPKG